MSLYVSTTYFGDGSQVEDALKDLEELKIKNIELGSNHSKSNQKFKLSKNSNFIVHNYFPPQEKNFILNIASTSPQIRDKSIRFIKNTINWCQKNEVKYYTIHPGFFAETISPLGANVKRRNFDLKFDSKSIVNKNRKKILEETMNVIKELYNFADGKTQLLIENQGSITSDSFTLFDSYLELQKLKKTVGNRLKFNFNLAHAYLSGINLRNKKNIYFIFKNALFFEVSEVSGIYDSHLPVFIKRGIIGKLIYENRDLFRKKNLILEYRNIPSSDLKLSYTNFVRLNSF